MTCIPNPQSSQMTSHLYIPLITTNDFGFKQDISKWHPAKLTSPFLTPLNTPINMVFFLSLPPHSPFSLEQFSDQCLDRPPEASYSMNMFVYCISEVYNEVYLIWGIQISPKIFKFAVSLSKQLPESKKHLHSVLQSVLNYSKNLTWEKANF